MREAENSQPDCEGGENSILGPFDDQKLRRVRSRQSSRSAIKHDSDPSQFLCSKKTCRSHEEERDGDDIGNPTFRRSTNERAEINLEQLLAGPDDEASHDCTWDGGKTTQNYDRHCLECDQIERRLHAELGAPDGAGNQANDTGDTPDNDPYVADRHTNRDRRLMVIGNGTK